MCVDSDLRRGAPFAELLAQHGTSGPCPTACGEVGHDVERLGPLLPGQARRAARWARTSSSVGGASRPDARGRRRRRARRGARRARRRRSTSATASRPSSSSSTSWALMFSPPRMMMSDDAVGDREVAVVVEHADVAGAVPAVGVEHLRR